MCVRVRAGDNKHGVNVVGAGRCRPVAGFVQLDQ